MLDGEFRLCDGLKPGQMRFRKHWELRLKSVPGQEVSVCGTGDGASCGVRQLNFSLFIRVIYQRLKVTPCFASVMWSFMRGVLPKPDKG